MIVLGLGVSRKETKRIHNFLNNQKNFNFDFESDIHKISWDNSENIVINRIKELENRLYNNTAKLNKWLKNAIYLHQLPFCLKSKSPLKYITQIN